MEIEASTENDGSYDWNVPCENSDESLVRISDIDGVTFDESDEVFSIFCEQPPNIDAILNFFDQSVANGTLKGRGSGWIAELRLSRMREMLVIAGEFIEKEKCTLGGGAVVVLSFSFTISRITKKNSNTAFNPWKIMLVR